MPLTVEAFEQTYRGHLDRHTEAAVAALKAVIAAPVPGNETVAYGVAEDWGRFPVRTLAIPPEGVTIDGTLLGRPLVPGDGVMIPAGALDRAAAEAAGETPGHIDRLVADWLAACWRAAGGAGFRWTAVLLPAGGPGYFDLRAGRWCDADAWRTAGGQGALGAPTEHARASYAHGVETPCDPLRVAAPRIMGASTTGGGL